MTVLVRILTVVGLGVLGYLIFFGKPREVVIETPAEPQVEKLQVQPQPPMRGRPRSQPKPQPAAEVTFEPESDQPVFRSLQAQPKPAQTQKVRNAPSVYEWEEPYNAAMIEKDRSKRQERIDAAQTAINRRIEEIRLNTGDGSPEERQAIRNAQLGLNLLRESSDNGQSRR
jgi:hypothetical protein